MSKSLHVLIVEDSEDDTVLILNALKKGGFNPKWSRVESKSALKHKIRARNWDIVLADYNLPQLSGLDALDTIKKQNPDIPFILISGSMGEEVAAEAMRAGAQDYILKDNLIRLAPIVERELKEARVKKSKRKVEIDVLKEKEFTQAILDASHALVVVINCRGKIIQFNRACMRTSGYSKEEVEGKPIWDILLLEEEKDRYLRDFQTLCSGVLVKNSEYHWKEKYGPPRLIAWSNTVLLNDEERVRQIISVGIDITEREEMEGRVRKELQEKTLLLKEIHHRVKNNMQIIDSLMGLQVDFIRNKKIRDILEETRGRVRSMSTVHEFLYESPDLSCIDLSDCVYQLVKDLRQSYEKKAAGIDVQIKINDLFIGIDLAVPLALILNELLTNAFQHAFPGSWEGKGKIVISFKKNKNNQVCLTVQDNGIGMPSDTDIQNIKSMGLHLVWLLVEDQIEGSLKLNTENGTAFKITFRQPEHRVNMNLKMI